MLRRKLARTQQALSLLEQAKDRYDSLYYHAITRLSEALEQNEALRQSQKMESLACMAGGIAHDFNNLFQCILAEIELLRSGRLAECRQEKAFDRVLESLQRAWALSGQMLHYSGGGFRQSVPLDLRKLVEQQIPTLSTRAGREVLLEPGETELTVHGDPGQLAQVLAHLVENAAESMGWCEDPVRIRILRREEPPAPGTGYWASPAPEGPCVILAVADSGEGIAPDRLGSVCDPFQTTRESGRGLGLSATLGILRGHGAGFLVESLPGRGSCFMAFFPLLVVDEPPCLDVQNPSHVGLPTVLVVDDEPAVRSTCAEILQEFFGYRTLEAGSGLEAIEVYRQHGEDIGVILMDASMPGLNGGEAFESIKRLRPDAKAVLCSGYSEAISRDTFQRHGFSTFLKKPFTARELKEALDFAMGSLEDKGPEKTAHHERA